MVPKSYMGCKISGSFSERKIVGIHTIKKDVSQPGVGSYSVFFPNPIHSPEFFRIWLWENSTRMNGDACTGEWGELGAVKVDSKNSLFKMYVVRHNN